MELSVGRLESAPDAAFSPGLSPPVARDRLPMICLIGAFLKSRDFGSATFMHERPVPNLFICSDDSNVSPRYAGEHRAASLARAEATVLRSEPSRPDLEKSRRSDAAKRSMAYFSTQYLTVLRNVFIEVVMG
jgi:hypothetical protein